MSFFLMTASDRFYTRFKISHERVIQVFLKIFGSAHEVLVRICLKPIFEISMLSYLVGYRTRLYGCAGWFEAPLVTYIISTKISCIDSLVCANKVIKL